MPVEDPVRRQRALLETIRFRTPEDEQRRAQERAQRRAAKASTDEVSITVGGDPVPFSIVRDGPLWAAVPTTADLGVTVLGMEEEPSRLRLVTVDPQDYLDGTVALARADGRL
jgi:hypothetical protein